MLSKFWCPVDLIGRINSAEDGFGRARFFGDLSRQPSEMEGTREDFSREPAEFLAGKGEERRGEERAFDTFQITSAKSLCYYRTYLLLRGYD